MKKPAELPRALKIQKLFCVIYASDSPDDGNFDLSGIFEFRLEFVCDFLSKENRRRIVDDLGLYHNADFAPCLNSVRLLDAVKGVCDCFKVFDTRYVVFKRLATCAGTSA